MACLPTITLPNGESRRFKTKEALMSYLGQQRANQHNIEGDTRITNPDPNQGLEETDIADIENTSDDNLFIDMIMQNFMHEHSAKHRLKGGNFDNLVELGSEKKLIEMGYTQEQIDKMDAREKEDTVNDHEFDLNDPNTHEYFMSTNRNSAGNIGIFANSSSFHNKMTSIAGANIVPSGGDKNGIGKLNVIKGLLGLSNSDSVSLSQMTTTDSDGNVMYISELQSEDIAASVDGTKRPSHAHMGVNRDNINTYTVFTMVGMNRRQVMNVLDFINYDFYKMLTKKDDRINLNSKLDVSFHKLAKQVATLLPSNLQTFSEEGLVKYLLDIDRNGNENGEHRDFIASITKDPKAGKVELINALIFASKSINDFSDSVTKNVLNTRFDSNNSRPTESISKMMKTHFDRASAIYGMDTSFRVSYSEDFRYNFSNQFFEYSYVEMLKLLKNKLNIQAQGRIYSMVPHFNPKVSERVIRHSYTNYMLENLIIPGYGKIDSSFINVFPNFALTKIHNSDSLKDLSFFQSLAINKSGALTILKDSVIHKDTFISDWDSAYRDSETKELALMLAMYSIYQDGFEFGSNKMGYFIPPSIMRDMNVFTEISKNPSILYDYIDLELLSQTYPISGFTIDNRYLADKYKDLGLKFESHKILSIENIPSKILEDLLNSYIKYARGRKVHEKIVSFVITEGFKRRTINAKVVKDIDGNYSLQDLSMLEETLQKRSLTNKKQTFYEDVAESRDKFSDDALEAIFTIDSAHLNDIESAKQSESVNLNESYVEEAIFGNEGFKDLDQLPEINRNINILRETIQTEFTQLEQQNKQTLFTEKQIEAVSERLVDTNETFKELFENLSEEHSKEFIEELLEDIDNCL